MQCYQIVDATTGQHLGFTTEGRRGTRNDTPTCSYTLINGVSGYGARLDKFHVELPGEMKSSFYTCHYERDVTEHRAMFEGVLFTEQS